MVVSEALTPLGAEDARILALETGPIRGHTLKVLLLDDAPGESAVADLRAEVARRLPEAPRWTQRLVPAPDTPTGLAWQDDPGFDVARHVRAAGDGRPVDDAGLRLLVAESMKSPLARDRPLWVMDVVPRLADGRWAILWKMHHCLVDGMAAMRAGARLLWTEAPPRPVHGPNASHPSRPPQPTTPGAPARFAAGARLAKLYGYRGLVLREFRRVRGGLSPLAADVGPDRAVAFARCTLAELRAIGKAVSPEATVNDVLLSAVAGALRRWLRLHNAPPARMKAQVPVSMHALLGDDAPAGNRDSFFFVNLPLDEDDPVARLRALSRSTGLRKNRHDARAIYALRETLGRAPEPVRRALQRLMQGPYEYSLNVSNVPGPAGPVRVLGRRVDAMYTFAEVAPHHALRVAALSLSGELFIGLCADPRAVPDLDVLAAGVRLSVDELRDRLHARAS